MWVQKSTVALKSLSAALFICRHHPYCHVRVAVDNDWTCCPRYLPFPQLCSEHLREYGPPESLLHSNGPLWPTYLQFMPAKLQSCHFRKETGFHFPRGPQIKPLNKRKVVGRCWTKRRKKAGKKKKKLMEERLQELTYLQCTTMGPASGGLRNFTCRTKPRRPVA